MAKGSARAAPSSGARSTTSSGKGLRGVTTGRARVGMRRASRAIGRGSRATRQAALKVARRAGRRSQRAIKVIKNQSHNIAKHSKTFKSWGRDRMRQIKNRLRQIERNKGWERQEELVQEAGELQQEQEAFDHLKNEELLEEEGIKNRFKPRFIKTSNRIAKIVAIQERRGNVDPEVLRQFGIYEQSLTRKILEQQRESARITFDEYNTLKKIRTELRKELGILRIEYKKQSGFLNRRNIKIRIKEVILEMRMIDNMIHLSGSKMYKIDKLKKYAYQIYNAVKYLST